MKTCPDRAYGNVENVGNLVAAISLDLEEHESDAPLLAHLRKEQLENALLLSRFERRDGARPDGRQVLHRHRLSRGEDAANPATAPMLANLPRGDAMQPARHVAAVEIAEPSANDEKHLLREILLVGFGRAEGAHPARDVIEPRVVDRGEVERLWRQGPIGSGRACRDPRYKRPLGPHDSLRVPCSWNLQGNFPITPIDTPAHTADVLPIGPRGSTATS